MLGLKNPFKRNLYKPKHYIHPNSVAAYKNKRKTVNPSQVAVLRALEKLERPAHYRMISQTMGVIEGSVTPRIAELRRKGLIKVAYVNVGLNRVRVNYYVVTGRGFRFLDKHTEA